MENFRRTLRRELSRSGWAQAEMEGKSEFTTKRDFAKCITGTSLKKISLTTNSHQFDTNHLDDVPHKIKDSKLIGFATRRWIEKSNHPLQVQIVHTISISQGKKKKNHTIRVHELNFA